MWRSWLVAGVLVSLLAACTAGAAPAPEKDPTDPAAGKADDKAHGGDDIFGKALDLGLWTVVVFLVLLFILSRFAWKPMLEGLQAREENIRGALEEAQRARDEAHNLRAQLQKEMAGAHEQVRELIEEARRDAQHTKDDLIAQARNEIQGERDRLRREIDTAKDQALQELWNQAAQVATLISAKAIRRQITPDDHRRLVDEAVVELKQAGDRRRRDAMS